MKNKVIIITGASSGIGEALAFALAKNGNKLVLSARNIGKLDLVKEKIKKENMSVISIETDVSKVENCKILIEKTIAEFGRIDVLINNAGISMRAFFNESDLDVITKVMNTNFWGTVYCTKYALPHLLKVKGSLVGISSIAGHIGLPERSAYSASKFAMNGFLESIRSEELENNLHVLIACPGFTASNIRRSALTKDGTPQTRSPRNEKKMMTAKKVAKEIICAIDCKKDTLTLSANGKLVVWLNRFFPKIAKRLIFNHFSKEKKIS
ncbi:MAG: SDR family oxidoreductase [Flavobacteriales bacterium]|jgi:short-subunit dehydrogenase|nr:SDR family oxidoreductase [Flavobacteriales bacterium]MDP7430195.1 SDR family oxidoreductase [Flavobacteriales bacterium]HJN63416.1 SDR family oxidoreductase [Flavobacteriales bacterium]|tara:strand:- start:12241 stop:13041 length:801 start_codon:yes stop_codon:yes gene_type:complete